MNSSMDVDLSDETATSRSVLSRLFSHFSDAVNGEPYGDPVNNPSAIWYDIPVALRYCRMKGVDKGVAFSALWAVLNFANIDEVHSLSIGGEMLEAIYDAGESPRRKSTSTARTA